MNTYINYLLPPTQRATKQKSCIVVALTLLHCSSSPCPCMLSSAVVAVSRSTLIKLRLVSASSVMAWIQRYEESMQQALQQCCEYNVEAFSLLSECDCSKHALFCFNIIYMLTHNISPSYCISMSTLSSFPKRSFKVSILVSLPRNLMSKYFVSSSINH